MVIVSNRYVRYDVDEKYLSYSPYISAAIDMIEKSGSLEGDVVIEGVSTEILSNYIQFLLGNPFVLKKDDAEFFDFMGHANHMEYPLPYWKLKLASKWTRDNFYRLDLCNRDSGLYGLRKLGKVNDINIFSRIEVDTKRDGVVIAGGAALFMTGVTRSFNDIDLFSLDKEKSLRFFLTGERPLTTDRVKCQANSISSGMLLRITNDITNTITQEYKKISLIRRVYRCPSEIVHGFDLDISQFVVVYDDNMPVLYGTDIGIYAAMNMVSWVDPEMASTTYLERLAKYQKRGFKVKLPLIQKCNVSIKSLPGYKKNSLLSMKSMLNSLLPNTSRVTRIMAMREEVLESGVPHDLGSILIYLGFFDLDSRLLVYALSTAERTQEEVDIMMQRYDRDTHSDECVDVPWIEIDPMSQGPLTGIIYPMSMENITDIYKASPLYKRC